MDTQSISKNVLERYNKRYNKLGRNIRTLGWGSIDQQEYRFLNTLDATLLNDKSILDIGCGFGDYKSFLERNELTYSSYEGWDLNPNFIKEANENNASGNATFKVQDVANDNIKKFAGNYDAAVMLGVLNFNLGSKENNLSFSRMMISRAFDLVKSVLIVDFLSSNLSPEYPKEDFVYYHNPATVMEIASELSPDFVIKHNYHPIPQKEFMLYLYKK